MLSLLFGRRKASVFSISETTVLELDATISEESTFNNEITRYPVENGSVISDNINDLPIRFELQGFITNSPLNIINIFESQIETIRSLPQTFRGEFPNTRSQNAYNILTRLRKNKELFDITTGYEKFTNMFFETLSFPRDRQTGDALYFTATLINIETAQTEFVSVPLIDDEYEDLVDTKKDVGSQATKELTDEQTEKSQDLITQILNAVPRIRG